MNNKHFITKSPQRLLTEVISVLKMSIIAHLVLSDLFRRKRSKKDAFTQNRYPLTDEFTKLQVTQTVQKGLAESQKLPELPGVNNVIQY